MKTMSNPLDMIVENIESKKSFCFNSGAGSGKTYNLVKTIEYISEHYGKRLLSANQKIMVITYTNAATNEIIKRIGKSRICDISTIHTRLWELVNKFQSDLLDLHLRKINETISEIESDLKSNPYASDSFLRNEIETNKEFINDFYKYSSIGAGEFKTRFSKYTEGQQISAVTPFKEFVKKTNKLLKLMEAKDGIKKGLRRFRKVEYDPFDNNDKLYKMKFSHNTLIDYSYSLIERNKTIRRIIVDKYPYVLIDEYQDTAEKVIKSFGLLVPQITIGFYGDNCQNIYGEGVGNRLFELLPNLSKINNEINRRSASKIVNLGNIIRNDSNFKQIPSSNEEGSVQVYYSKTEDDKVIDSFISKVLCEFKNSEVNFFLLKNEQVASKSGFGNFYSVLSGTKHYKDNFNQTSTEILSDDETKLGEIPHNIYQILKLRRSIMNENEPVSQYIPSSVYEKMNLHDLSVLIDYMKETCECNNFDGMICNFCRLYNCNESAKTIIESNISNSVFDSKEKYNSYLFENLYGEIAEDKISEAQSNIDTLLSTSISELDSWYNYILRIGNRPVNYYTFHGTKGLEFENVGVIITNRFNNKRDYYHSFFKELAMEQKSDDFIEKKNLLYVSMTRAKKNLRILYIDQDFDCISESFNSIFNDSEEFNAIGDNN